MLQIVQVIVVVNMTTFSLLAIVYTCLQYWPDNGHLGDDSRDLDILIKQVGSESTGGHVVAPEVALEVYVVHGLLLWEVVLSS